MKLHPFTIRSIQNAQALRKLLADGGNRSIHPGTMMNLGRRIRVRQVVKVAKGVSKTRYFPA